MEIKICHLCKSYGKQEVLKDVSMTIGLGMYGLLGKNGAGKTTLMRILAALLEPDAGEVTINGVDIRDKRKIRGMIGYLPQEFSMYPNMRVEEALDYLGILARLPRRARKDRIAGLLKNVNLEREKNRRIKELSGGMKRRFGIAQALLNDPEILIVDEPTAGLDPEERVYFGNLLSSYARDRIVLLSTHIVNDIETGCSNLAVLSGGSVLFQGQVSELLFAANGKVYMAALTAQEFEALKEHHRMIHMQQEKDRFICRFLCEGEPKPEYIACTPTMEDAYLWLLQTEKEVLSYASYKRNEKNRF